MFWFVWTAAWLFVLSLIPGSRRLRAGAALLLIGASMQGGLPPSQPNIVLLQAWPLDVSSCGLAWLAYVLVAAGGVLIGSQIGGAAQPEPTQASIEPT